MSAQGGSLLGRRVAVTRAAEQSGDLAERLRALGAEVLCCPLIAIAPPLDPAPLAHALARLEAYDWLALPSANAARAALGGLIRPGRRPRIAAVGSATAAALAEAGISADLTPAEHSAAGLLAALGDVCGARVLLPQGDQARPELAEGLAARGASVDAVAAYRTLPGPGVGALAAALRARALDAVTFASPSAARALLDGAGQAVHELLAGAALVAIGPTTAAALRAEGLRVASVADPHTAAGLAAALVALLARG